MHGPQPGKYILKVAFGPRPSIGANFGGPPTVPVVADGPDKLFTVSKLNDGNYILSLEHRFTREDHGNVVATLDRQAAGIWSIRAHEDGLYTIEVPDASPPRGWTLYDTSPHAYVAVGNIDPLPGHKWEFIRIDRE